MTRVGYTGGGVPHAAYRNHTGHAEAIEIIFDPTKVAYRLRPSRSRRHHSSDSVWADTTRYENWSVQWTQRICRMIQRSHRSRNGLPICSAETRGLYGMRERS